MPQLKIPEKPIYKKRLQRGDYYYKEGDGKILSYGSFNSDGGYNYITYFQARDIMSKVRNWSLNGDDWARGSYIGEIGPMQVVLMCGEQQIGKMRITDKDNNLILAVYQNPELCEDFWRVHKPFEDRKNTRVRNRINASLNRVAQILGENSRNRKAIKK